MKFDIVKFKGQIDDLSSTGCDYPAEDFIGKDGLCAIDLCDIGFVLEDAFGEEEGTTFKAEDVFSLEIGVLSELVSRLPDLSEAA